MKKIHRLALIFMILCCTFLFCGCATVSYSVIETENGGVGQVIDIELDEKQLGSAGATASQITKMKSDIATIMTNKQTEIMNNYLQKVQNDKSLTSAQRQMLAEGVDTDVKVADSTVSASFVFVNTATYYYFYDIDTSDSDEQVVEKKEGLFYRYTRYEQSAKTAQEKDKASYETLVGKEKEAGRENAVYGLELGALSGGRNSVTKYVKRAGEADASGVTLLVFDFKSEQEDLQYEAIAFINAIVRDCSDILSTAGGAL